MVGATRARGHISALVGSVALSLAASLAYADTLEGALVQAYQNNPSLNSQRALVRATDENVPQALSGYRPKVTANASIGTQYWDTTSKLTTTSNIYLQQSGQMTPYGYGLTATQTLYNGFQTSNRTRQAAGTGQGGGG